MYSDTVKERKKERKTENNKCEEEGKVTEVEFSNHK